MLNLEKAQGCSAAKQAEGQRQQDLWAQTVALQEALLQRNQDATSPDDEPPPLPLARILVTYALRCRHPCKPDV